MSSTTNIMIGRNTVVFAKKETVPGTLVIPAAGDLIRVISGDLQKPDFTYEDDKSLRNSRSSFSRFETFQPGSPLKLSSYIRPSGAAGTPPEAACLWESAFGTYLNTPATKDEYTLAEVQPSFSLYVKKDQTVFVSAGCAIDKLAIKKDNKSMLAANWDGKGLYTLWTGTDSLTEAIGTTPAQGTEEEWTVAEPKKFCTGSHIKIDTEQMQVTGTAWEGTAAAGHIKLKRGYNSSAVATHLNAAPVLPYLPTGTETGAPLPARLGAMTVDAVTFPFLDIDFNLENGITQNDEENTGLGRPSDFFEGERKISGKMNVYFRGSNVAWFADAVKQTRKAVLLNFGTIAGKMLELSLPSCEFSMPQYSGDAAHQKLDIPLRAFGVAGGDEVKATFK